MTTDVLQWLHFTTVLPEFLLIPYKLTIVKCSDPKEIKRKKSLNNNQLY